LLASRFIARADKDAKISPRQLSRDLETNPLVCAGHQRDAFCPFHDKISLRKAGTREINFSRQRRRLAQTPYKIDYGYRKPDSDNCCLTIGGIGIVSEESTWANKGKES
jgi:hypothetical protein